MKNVIILNGAPGIGKDTIAEIIARKWEYRILSFKSPMFDIARTILGATDFARFAVRYHDRKRKEVKYDFLGDRSPREFMIHISENFVKPTLGKNQFGKLLCDSALTSPFNCIVSDGGFDEEVEHVAAHEALNVFVVRLHRDGMTFEGDSRKHIRRPDLICDTYHELDFDMTTGEPEDDAQKILDMVSDVALKL